jgi:hypothetical protein
MSWLHRVLGRDVASVLAIDAENFAARVSQKPQALGASGGAYVLSVQSGLMAAGLAANAEIFSLRWTSASKVMLPRSIIFGASRDTTAFATGQALIRATIARGFSTDGSGGTAIVFSTNNTNKKRASFPLSAFSDTGVRVSSTAALTGATKTFDTNDIGSLSTFISTGATSVPDPYIIPPGSYLWQRNTGDEYPLYFVQNEGFALRATVPITGTWRFTITIEWAEVIPSEVNL